jgi:hypothetical protein
MQRALTFFILTSLSALRIGTAQEKNELRVERREVAYRNGGSVHRLYFLYPEQSTAEVAFDQPIDGNGSRTLRVHFKVEKDTPGSTWFVELVGAHGAAKWTSTEGDRLRGEFWSGEIDGDHADAVLHVLGKTRNVQIQIDQYAVTGIETKPQSITTKREDIKPILDQPDDIQKLGRSIARIRFIGADGGRYFCTGFLVASNVLMTNEHCFSSPQEATSALVDFDFDAPASKPKTAGVSKLLWNNFNLDYALAALSAVPDEHPPLRLAVGSIQEGKNLMVIEHPEGQFKQVSIINCMISNGSHVSGRGPGKTDFSHSCNTMGGSSGSAIWDRNSGEVIGLHHFGFREGADKPSNQAIDMGEILEDVYAHDPNVYWSFAIANPKHPKR